MAQSAFSQSSLMPITFVTGTSSGLIANNKYVANNAGLVTLTLPAIISAGSVIEVAGMGAGGWRIAQVAGQTINLNSSVTTTGVAGYLESTNRYNAVSLLCLTANTVFVVVNLSGNITVA